MNSPESLKYGRAVTLDVEFDRAVERVKSRLKDQGFGVLCEIDVAKTMKEKIGAEMPAYLILGACNPNLADRALSVDNQLGLLLPCNVVVQSRGGKTVVSAVDAGQMLGVVGNDELAGIAEEANSRLRTVLDHLAAS